MTQMVARADKSQTLKDLLEKAGPSIASVLPKHLTLARMTKVVLSCVARKPELLACSPMSLVKAVMQGAELGLEAGGLLGEGYLVPFKGEIVFIPGYRGLIKLARQSGEISSLEAHVVCVNDTFELEYGLNPKLIHKPFMAGDPGAVFATYSIARFKDGGHQADVMSLTEINAIRDRSQAAKAGPWVTDFNEMAKKTVVRRMCKYLPLSPELARALEHEAAIDEGVRSPILDITLFDEATGEIIEEPSRADGIKAKLAANGTPS